MKGVKTSKPDIAQLKSKGYNLIDMHIHTNASSDCSVSLQSILKKAKKMGIGIAITDHDKIDSAVSAVNNDSGVLVIPGVEVSMKKGRHLLFYFYNKKELIRFYNNEVKNSFLDPKAEDLNNLKKEYSCMVGIAHPVGHRLWDNFSINPCIKEVDFLDVLNGACSKKKALKSHNRAEEYKKGMVAGSDAHILKEVGRCLTCSKGEEIKSILDSIKSGETQLIGKPLSLKEKLERFPKDTLNLAVWLFKRLRNKV